MPRDGSSTRDRILVTAERLTIEHGFSATSLDRVIAESKTSKGSFFHHFRSKADLAEALVSRYAASDIAHLHRALEAVADQPTASERLLAFLDYFVDDADELMAAQSSCLYVAALTEQELIKLGTTQPIEEAIIAWRTAISSLVSEAIVESAIEAIDLDPDALADHLFVTFEGSFILCRATGEASHMRRQLEVLRNLVAAVLTR